MTGAIVLSGVQGPPRNNCHSDSTFVFLGLERCRWRSTRLRPARAFTLIELLVVITIIVVLLALLTPALDQAIYQAELAVCGSNLHAIGSGTHMYAVDYKRAYPHRSAVDNPDVGWRDASIAAVPPLGDDDDRPEMRGHIAINKMLNCPLNKWIDLEGSTSHTEAPYQLWFGFRFYQDGAARPGMMKLGDRLAWREHRFDLLASDMDDILEGVNATFGTHPDRDGLMGHLWQQDTALFTDAEGLANPLTPDLGARWTISRWQSVRGLPRRGMIDRNFLYGDGSVSRIIDITERDAREARRGLVKAPIFDQSNDDSNQYTTLPREGAR